MMKPWTMPRDHWYAFHACRDAYGWWTCRAIWSEGVACVTASKYAALCYVAGTDELSREMRGYEARMP